MKNILLTSSALVIACLFTAGPSNAQQEPLSYENRQAIVKDVIEHFKANPEDLVEAIIQWRERAKPKDVATHHVLNAEPIQPALSGNAKGDVVVFEFVDYGCEPCRKVSGELMDVVNSDPKAAVVHYDYPISGEDGLNAALDFLAVKAKGGNWKEVRDILVTEGSKPETRIKALAQSNVEIGTPERAAAIATIRKNRDIAKTAGVTVLPAIVVQSGEHVIALNGEIAPNAIAAAISKVRAQSR